MPWLFWFQMRIYIILHISDFAIICFKYGMSTLDSSSRSRPTYAAHIDSRFLEVLLHGARATDFPIDH
ncbi:hypothetical protein ACM1RC_19420 [Paenibacillus azoreducens]|uniref:hypothetical protein n=1 Tax=Paenibacillus azoreducens TaxID=116718 RepID=UPI0039F596B1